MSNFFFPEFSVAKKYRHIWTYLAKQDIKSRFRRSKIGVLWVVLNQLAFSLGAGYIWATVFHLEPAQFIPFLSCGFAIWGFISSSMGEGCGTFVIAHGYIKQIPLPLDIFIFRALLVQIFFLAVGLLTALGVLLFYKQLSITNVILTVPGFFILAFYGYATIGAMSYLGLRYRDLQHGLAGLFSLLFVVTPVIYPPEVLIKKGLHLAIFANPFASLIEIIRNPLIHGTLADSKHYLIATLFSIIMYTIKKRLEKKWAKFVPFWS